MIKEILVAASLAALAIAAPAQAARMTDQTELIDFETTPIGRLIEDPGTSRSAVGSLLFRSFDGESLYVGDYNVQSDGVGLAVYQKTGNGLLAFSLNQKEAKYISLEFGNDDPFGFVPGDLAKLDLFLTEGRTTRHVATVTVAVNGNDLMDQTISYAGRWTNFVFTYTDASGDASYRGGGQLELVDNITIIRSVVSDVPEPTTWAMMLCGLGAVGAGMRSRRQADGRVVNA